MAQHEQTVLDFVSSPNYSPMTPRELMAALKEKPDSGEKFDQLIAHMADDALICISKKGRVMSLDSCGMLRGPFAATERGFGFVVREGVSGGDLFIPIRFSMGAMHGDLVLGRITVKATGATRAEGEVVRIIKRNRPEVIGTYEKEKGMGYLVPDDKKLCPDIIIPKKGSMDAKNGDKVIVAITRFPDGRRPPEGRVISVLGPARERGANYEAILYSHGVKTRFPEEVLAEAKAVPTVVGEGESEGRLDLRGEVIFTIDGADAKDFDDAISISKRPDGVYSLGVHIADVSHYVTAGSPLDTEALLRGTSIYFVDKVVPMLPEALSNGICSLNPDVDRLAFSVFMEIDADGAVISHDIKKTIIKSCARLIYSDVTKVIEGKSPELSQKYEYLLPRFRLMDELAHILGRRRTNRGSINFDLPEAKITVDEKGDPVDISPRERGVADHIIEEFMLVTNETVAKHVYDLQKPFVYRVHEKPDPEKTQKLLAVVGLLGYFVGAKEGEVSPMALQKLLSQIQGKPEQLLLSTMVLRSMMKARYSPDNLGHFGLAAKFYCHFTSPIRRYPDLVIHRILGDIITGRLGQKTEKKYRAFVSEAALKSSEAEQRAVDAERDIDDLYKAIYMSRFIGAEFDGIISSVTSFGMFVALPNTVEGLIHVRNLDDDYYSFDEGSLCLRGERTGKVYRMGDPVRIKVAASDIISRNIDFALATED